MLQVSAGSGNIPPETFSPLLLAIPSAPLFHTVVAGVRPPRLAILVDAAEQHWQVTCECIIEYLTAAWGGKHSIIIPTDGTSIAPMFWALLEAFDPDYCCVYHKTGRDWELTNPATFQNVITAYLASAYRDPAPPDAAERVLQQFRETPQDHHLG